MTDNPKNDFDMFADAPSIEPLSKESTPCVGCGWCCLTDPCSESHQRYGYTRRCPDLVWDEGKGRYLCGLMLDPDRGGEVRRSQHAGQGCYAPLNAWRKNVRNRDNDQTVRNRDRCVASNRKLSCRLGQRKTPPA